MACGCRKNKVQYVWTSDDGTSQVIYPTKIQAAAKVTRAGGSYIVKGG